MAQKKLLKFLFLLKLIAFVSPGPLQRWTFELLEINTNSSDRKLVDVNTEVIRLGRGKFGFNAFMNFKVDLYDDVLVRVTMEISSHRDGPYYLMPMRVENETLTNAMNKYYKPFIQSSAEKCCINHPVVENTFVPPLTKRNIIMNKCALSTDDMPNIMPTGYIRVRTILFGPFYVIVETISYIENKIL